MKVLSILFLLLFSWNSQASDFALSVQNSMMTGSGAYGDVSMGIIEPFSPQTFCNSFSAPNTCSVVNNNRDLNVTLSFGYLVEIFTTGSIDISFSADNGLNNTVGQFQNLTLPSNIYNAGDQTTGSMDVSFQIPMFGPNSNSDYGLLLTIDVVYNP